MQPVQEGRVKGLRATGPRNTPLSPRFGPLICVTAVHQVATLGPPRRIRDPGEGALMLSAGTRDGADTATELGCVGRSIAGSLPGGKM